MQFRSNPKRLLQDTRGNIAILFGLAAPMAILMVGGAIDFAAVSSQRHRLQAVVDGAALAAARGLGLADARRENVAAVVDAIVQSSMTANREPHHVAPTTITTVQDAPLQVDVVARQGTSLYFGTSAMFFPRVIEVNSVARIIGRPNVCVLALDPSTSGTISLEKNAHVTGNNCAVFSNSTQNNGIKSKNSSVLSASMICSAGGKDGGPGNFTPEPITDCPTFDDPLAPRPEPLVGACDATLPKKITSSRSIGPGTYCGGLEITAGAVVTLDPGIYVIKDGPLRVNQGATLKGDGVGLYLTGKSANLNFEQASTIDLAAPRDGMMAGILFFEARSQPTSGAHQITSDDARNLLGTIYLSRGTLSIDAGTPVADKSAYTAIVTRMLTLSGGPNLVLNTSYDLTDVPVPEGIRGAAQPVSLVK